MRHLFRSNLLKRTFLSYIALFALCLSLFAVFTIQDIQETRRQQSQKAFQEEADSMMYLIEQNFTQIRSISSKLSHLSWIWKLSAVNRTFEDEFDPVKRRDIVNDLKVYLENDSLLQNLTLFFPEQDIAISSKGWSSIDGYFQLVACNLPDLKDVLSKRHEYAILYLNQLYMQRKPVIWMVKSLDYTKSPRIQAAFSFDKQYLLRLVEEAASANLCSFTLTDETGNELLSVNKKSPPKNTTGYQVEIYSKTFPWTYRMVYDTTLHQIELKDLMRLLLFSVAILLIGPLAALLLSYLSYRPLQALLDKAVQHTGREPVNEYRLLEDTFSRLREDNREMKTQVSDYREFVQHDMFIRLLKGYFYKDAPNRALSYYGIDYTEDNHFCVLLAEAVVESPDEQESLDNRMMATLLLRKELENCPFHCQFVQLFDDIMVMILSDQKAPLEMTAIQAYIKQLEEVASFSLFVWCGSIEPRIIGISKSYHTANQQYFEDTTAVPKSQELTTTDSTASFYYPTDWEIQLINGVKTGKQELVHKILEELQQENQRRALNPAAKNALFASLDDTVLRLSSELKRLGMEDAAAFPNSGDAEAHWTWLSERFQQLCQRITPQKDGGQDFAAQMIAYIQENFRFPTLSLKEIAMDLGISMPVASKTFKNATSINFYDYTCRLRMEKAKALMREGKVSVKELCGMVGYENEYSLRRTFQRYEGISITEFRKKIKREKEEDVNPEV